MRLRFTAPATTGQLVADKASRRITGTLVPFDEVGTPSVGPPRIMFTADTALTWDERMLLNLEHDDLRPIGRAAQISATASGLVGVFQIAHTAAGSDALTEAAEGLRTGLSMEAEVTDLEDVDGVAYIRAAHIGEAALTRRPAFPAAQVIDVAATAATQQEEETAMPEATAVDEPTTDTPPTATVQAAAVPLSTARPASGLTVAASLPTAGEYLLASLSRDPARMSDMSRRIRAAAPHTFVADIPGLIPKAIAGPVLHLRDASAPLYNALGPNSAPAGASFRLPVASPELGAATIGVEKTDVTGQIGVTEITVTMDFIKKAVNISAEAVAWSQPSIIDVAVLELAESLAIGSEQRIVAKLEAATGTNTAVVIAVNGADAWAKLAAAVMTHYAASGRYPDVFATAPDVWAKLAGFTNSNGVPLIVGVDQNLTGQFGSLFGVPVVVSASITAGKSFLVSSSGVKSWTSGDVTMRVEEPTILGYAIGAGRGVGLSVASGKYITPVSIAAAE